MSPPWQAFVPPPAQWRENYPALMPDGSALMLPIRPIGVAGLIANQASFLVLDRLSAWLAEKLAPFQPEVIVGLPTLGHAVAPCVARALGHPGWVAIGHSRKLWYDEALSVSATSITTPDARRMWLDPRTLDQLHGKRVVLVDDVISTGRSIRSGLALLEMAEIRPVAVVALMAQTRRWQDGWNPALPVVTVFSTPLLRRDGDGAWQEAE